MKIAKADLRILHFMTCYALLHFKTLIIALVEIWMIDAMQLQLRIKTFVNRSYVFTNYFWKSGRFSRGFQWLAPDNSFIFGFYSMLKRNWPPTQKYAINKRSTIFIQFWWHFAKLIISWDGHFDLVP